MLGSRSSQTSARARQTSTGRAKTTEQKEAARPARPGTRPFLLLAVMALCAAGLVSRLVFWQVMQHGPLSAMARAQHAALEILQPVRGQIYDANGDLLARDITMDLVYARPKEVKDPSRTAVLLAPVLHQPEKQVYNQLTGDAPFPLLSPPLSAQDGQKVRDLALPGIILDPVLRRAYPELSSAAHVLGFANTDMQGQYGLERSYDSILSGTAGLRNVLKDTAGNDIHLSSGPSAPSHNGGDLHLSIDSAVQAVVEDELAKAVNKHGAIGGTIIVMDPRTGYILGMASNPTFDPNRYWKVSNSRYLNPATQWIYEPGSTMKVLTMAAGLDSGAITPQSALYDTGSFSVAGVTIHNWNRGGFGYENMTQVLQHSANVGAAWVAQRMGTSTFYTYIKRFGLGKPTGIDLDEEPGLFPLPGDKSWSIVNLYTNAYGQGLAVTPIQLLHAVGAVANGGVIMKPQVVKRMVYDGQIIDHPPVSQGRVISRKTAHTLTQMLVHSAIDGEAQLALVKGYDIAAKTGTANIADGHGGYLQGQTIASVVGYAPAYSPRFVALVILNRPKDQIWGSMTAAPVLHDLFQDLLMQYHIPPSPHALNK